METKSSENNLSIGFQRSVEKFPGRPALDVNNELYTYEELCRMAGCLSRRIKDIEQEMDQLIALFAYRSPVAYAGVLGILGVGCGYVPLHPELPTERNFKVLDLAKTNLMIVSRECRQSFDELLTLINRKMIFILVNIDETDKYAKDYSIHRFIIVNNLLKEDVEKQDIEPVKKDDIAYLLFTSGSTGEPKGVPVSHNNARSYIEFVSNRYEVNEFDRVSQMHDMTFDNSIHDIFLAWEIGACLCVVKKEDKFFPVSFIQKKEISLWFSVPSVAGMIDKYGRLEPEAFPSLRYSFFAGEALYMSIAEKWQAAARNSKLVNTYGPTETTITISYYDWDSKKSPSDCENGIVPLGKIFEGQQGRVIREDRSESGIGEAGELCLSGSQVTKGYWNNPEKTAAQYITFPDTGDTLWYRSGDFVRMDENGCLHYLGRIDNQIKIQGNRVELGAIDKILREASDVNLAVAVPLLVSAGNASAVVAFISSVKELNEKVVLEYCRKKLPKYMSPTKVYFIDDMPLNVNGKIDRLKLQKLLEMEL